MVTPAGTVEVGGAKAGGGMVAITPDGKTALVSRNADHKVSILSIDGTKVEYTKRDMTPGVRPIVLDVASNGAFAVVGSLAGGPTTTAATGPKSRPSTTTAASSSSFG